MSPRDFQLFGQLADQFVLGHSSARVYACAFGTEPLCREHSTRPGQTHYANEIGRGESRGRAGRYSDTHVALAERLSDRPSGRFPRPRLIGLGFGLGPPFPELDIVPILVHFGAAARRCLRDRASGGRSQPSPSGRAAFISLDGRAARPL
jgi:hypothetical protein